MKSQTIAPHSRVGMAGLSRVVTVDLSKVAMVDSSSSSKVGTVVATEVLSRAVMVVSHQEVIHSSNKATDNSHNKVDMANSHKDKEVMEDHHHSSQVVTVAGPLHLRDTKAFVVLGEEIVLPPPSAASGLELVSAPW